MKSIIYPDLNGGKVNIVTVQGENGTFEIGADCHQNRQWTSVRHTTHSLNECLDVIRSLFDGTYNSQSIKEPLIPPTQSL